jgi:methionyl-tRNA formyltransferase
MKYIYFSSGAFGAKVLSKLRSIPDLVITQADKLGGRGQRQLLATPVKQYCRQQKLAFTETLDQTKLSKFDLALVADYGVIIPAALLNQPKLGFFNIHPSLLPKYRGSTPLQSAILNDEKATGVSIIKMDEKVDHGDLVAQEKIEIDVNDTYLSLLEKTAILGAKMFDSLDFSKLKSVSQNHTKATYTNKLSKKDGYLPIEQLIPYLTPIFKKYSLLHLLPNQAEKTIDQQKLHNLIRGLSPWPGVWTKAKDKVIKLVSSEYNLKPLLKKISISGKLYQF